MIQRYIFLLCSFFSLSPVSYAAEIDKSSVALSDMGLFFILVGFIIVLLIIILVLSGAIRKIASNSELWKGKFPKVLLAIFSISLFSMLPMNANAANSGSFVISDQTFYLLIAVIVFLFFVALFLGRTLQNLLNQLSGEKEQSLTSQWAANLTESVPVEREEEVMTDHEYDGIRELDNVLPPWWVYLFYATIVFAVIYIGRYHIFGSGTIMADEFATEVAEAKAEKEKIAEDSGPALDESNVTLLTADADLERGKNIFIANCASCHQASGAGGVGPNLTDPYWIHGGGIKNIFSTIKYGVPEKGMISWASQMKPDDMQKVASFIMSLEGSDPDGAKEPQGELYEGDAKDESEIESDSTMTMDTVTTING